MTAESIAMVIGLAALVLDYLRARKLDEETASRVVDLSVRVALLEARRDQDGHEG